MRFCYLLGLFFFIACAPQAQEQQSKEEQTSTKEQNPEKLFIRYNATEDSFGFVNKAGEWRIPLGKYQHSFTEEFLHYAVVVSEGGKLVAINSADELLYEVAPMDNGPDYSEDGLFRILVEGKYGFADSETGEIRIAPKYKCAFPFEEGKAKVAYNCEFKKMDEYTLMESDSWIFIDTKGTEL